MTELRYQDIKSVAYIDAIIHFAETLLGIRLKNVKKYRYIRKYRTIILVEGIFDYFAFYNLLQDQNKPVVNAISGFSLEHLKTDAQCVGRGLDVKMANIIKDDVRTYRY